MAWNVTTVSADFAQNQGVVVLTESGGTTTAAMSLNLSFQIVPPNQPSPQSATRQALIAQAKQILIGAANSLDPKASRTSYAK